MTPGVPSRRAAHSTMLRIASWPSSWARRRRCAQTSRRADGAHTRVRDLAGPPASSSPQSHRRRPVGSAEGRSDVVTGPASRGRAHSPMLHCTALRWRGLTGEPHWEAVDAPSMQPAYLCPRCILPHSPFPCRGSALWLWLVALAWGCGRQPPHRPSAICPLPFTPTPPGGGPLRSNPKTRKKAAVTVGSSLAPPALLCSVPLVANSPESHLGPIQVGLGRSSVKPADRQP